MVLYGSYVSVKIAQIKAGSKQRKLNFFSQVVEEK